MNVVLASVSFSTAFTFHKKFLSLGYIHAHAMADSTIAANVEITHEFYDSRFLDPEDIAEQIMELSPDLVGFSCYVWNTLQVLYTANQLKRIAPKVKIILGGPQVEVDYKEVLEQNRSVDFVSVGEGEDNFCELLKALLKGEKPSQVPGIAVNEKGCTPKILNTRPYKKNIDDFESPYLAGVLDLDEAVGGVYLQTTRGCPFECAYCDYGRNRPYSEFSLDRVRKELDLFKKRDVKWIFCVDATFNQNNKRAIKILRHVIDISLKSGLWFEAHPNLLDDEFVKAVSETYLTYIGLGIQTTNPLAMKNIRRNWDPKQISSLLDSLAVNNNFYLGLEIIMGLPGDDLPTFKDTLTWLYQRESSNINIFNLQVVPQTILHSEADKFEIVDGGEELDYNIISNGTFPADEILVGKAITNWNNQMQPVFYRMVKALGLEAGDLIEEWAWYVYNAGFHNVLSDLNRNRVKKGVLNDLSALFEIYCRGVITRKGLPDISLRMREFMRYCYCRRAVTDESAVFFESMDVNCITFEESHNRIINEVNFPRGVVQNRSHVDSFMFDMRKLWPLISAEEIIALKPELHIYRFFSDARGVAIAVDITSSVSKIQIAQTSESPVTSASISS